MKKFKKLIPAMVMLLIATMLMGTTTYAWFSMNTQVTATGMNVKAKAEGGIVISNAASGGTWANEAAAAYSDVVALYPTSTADTSKWYHAKSTDANNAAAGQTAEGAYTELTSSISYSDATNSIGVGYTESGATAGFQDAEDNCYFLLNKFYIKSSGDVMGTTENPVDLYINNVSITSTQSSSAHALQAIDASLRVAIVVSSSTYIYAPVTSVSTGSTTLSPTFSYKVANGDTATVTYNPTATVDGGTGSAAYKAGKNLKTAVTTIGNTDATAIPVSIYVYFEGEDANCKSVNVSAITMNNLEVKVQFGTTMVTG